jgi:hypothetical protein
MHAHEQRLCATCQSADLHVFKGECKHQYVSLSKDTTLGCAPLKYLAQYGS